MWSEYPLLCFLEEGLSLLYILLGILWCSFAPRAVPDVPAAFTHKKNFYYFYRGTLFFLFGCILLSGWNFWILATVSGPTLLGGDVSPWDYFYLTSFNQGFNTAFFQKGLVTVFFNCLLNALAFFYLWLLYETYKTSTPSATVASRLLEIPVLLVSIVFSLKLFLYTLDLLLLVLTLELAAFCTLILISYQAVKIENVYQLEAAIKYFFFNAVAISFFLFATCNYYLLTKSVNLTDISITCLIDPGLYYEQVEFFLVTHVFFFFAYLIKLGAVPFHQWVPDVYEGAELLTTALLVLLVGPVLNCKLFIFLKLLPLTSESVLFTGLICLGILSIVIGSFQAFLQVKVKRFLAYTGITHLGYILLGVGLGTFNGFLAGLFYLISYILTNCVFFALLILSRKTLHFSLLYLNQWKKLFTDNVLLLIFFLIPLFSFAGFPPFMGFFSKFITLVVLVEREYFGILLLLVFYIVLGAYLYLRFVKVTLFESLEYNVNVSVPTGTYTLRNRFKPKRAVNSAFATYKTFLFVLFSLNMFNLCFVPYLPVMFLFLQKLVGTVFLFH